MMPTFPFFHGSPDRFTGIVYIKSFLLWNIF
jgi:hypothetical protein